MREEYSIVMNHRITDNLLKRTINIMETNTRIIVPVIINKQTYILKTCFNVDELKFH